MAIVTLTWVPTTHRSDGSQAVAVNYVLQRRAGAGSYSSDLLSGIVGVSHRDTVPDPQLGEQIDYCYRIKAQETGYNDSPWVEACVGVGGEIVGPGSLNLVGTPGSTSIRAAASSTGGGPVDEWRFNHKLASASTWDGWSSWGAGSTYDFSGLDPGTAYQIQAEARNRAATETSAIVDVMTSVAEAVRPPTLALSATNDTVKATVGPAQAGAVPTRYLVEISTEADFSKVLSQQTLVPPGGTATLSNLSANTLYYVRATAYAGTAASTPTTDSVRTTTTGAVSFALASSARVETGKTLTVSIREVSPDTATFQVTAVGTPADPDVTAGSVTGSGATRSLVFTGVRDGSQAFDVTGSFGGRSDTTIRITVTSATSTCVPGIPSIETTATDFSVGATVSPAPDGCVPSEYQFQMSKGAPTSGSSPADDPETADPEFADTGWGPATSQTFRNLLTNTLYSVRARARSGEAESLWGEWTAWQPQWTRDVCAGASLAIAASPDRVLVPADLSPKDIALTVTRSANVVANPPTVTVPTMPTDLREFLITSIVQNTDGSHKLVVQAHNARPEQRVTGTLQVRVAGSCDTSATDDVEVTVEPPANQCAGVEPPTGAASTYRGGPLDMSAGDMDFIAQAVMGANATGMDITAESDTTTVIEVAAVGEVTRLRDLSGLNRDFRQRTFRLRPVGPGVAFVTVTFKSKFADTVCELRFATTAFEITVSSG